MSFAAAWLAQLGECWSAGQEITGSNPGQTNPWGLKMTEKKSVAFLMTSANSSSSWIRMKNHTSRLTALSLIWFLWDVKEPTPLFDKSRGHRPWWCGQPLLGWVGNL